MRLIKHKLRKLYDVYIKRDPKRITYYNYIDKGGEDLRLDYALEKDSVVFDIGGYIGDFAEDISGKFNCRIDVFEPVPQYAEKIRTRLAQNSKVNVIQAGLGGTEKEEFITIEGLGSSVFVNGREKEDKATIKIISIVDYIELKGYLKIDPMKINIEGGEFELLNALLDHPDLIKKIKYFQIQFHDFVPDAEKMRAEIQSRLSETHKVMWNFPFIWESWERIQ